MNCRSLEELIFLVQDLAPSVTLHFVKLINFACAYKLMIVKHPCCNKLSIQLCSLTIIIPAPSLWVWSFSLHYICICKQFLYDAVSVVSSVIHLSKFYQQVLLVRYWNFFCNLYFWKLKYDLQEIPKKVKLLRIVIFSAQKVNVTLSRWTGLLTLTKAFSIPFYEPGGARFPNPLIVKISWLSCQMAFKKLPKFGEVNFGTTEIHYCLLFDCDGKSVWRKIVTKKIKSKVKP